MDEKELQCLRGKLDRLESTKIQIAMELAQIEMSRHHLLQQSSGITQRITELQMTIDEIKDKLEEEGEFV